MHKIATTSGRNGAKWLYFVKIYVFIIFKVNYNVYYIIYKDTATKLYYIIIPFLTYQKCHTAKQYTMNSLFHLLPVLLNLSSSQNVCFYPIASLLFFPLFLLSFLSFFPKQHVRRHRRSVFTIGTAMSYAEGNTLPHSFSSFSSHNLSTPSSMVFLVSSLEQCNRYLGASIQVFGPLLQPLSTACCKRLL